MSQSKIQLKATRADSISFTNNMQGSGQLKIGFKYSYNLRHAAPGVARGEVTITAEDREAPDKLSITVKQSGIFALPPEMPREESHLETFRILFPYASATLTATTSIAGVQGIIVPRIDITEENIYRVEFKPPRPDGSEE
jgi:preprotein translocase subunit SecB